MRIEPEQIPILVDHFVQKYCTELGLPKKQVSSRLMKNLVTHSWTGPSRELEETIKRAIIRAPREMILGDVEFPPQSPEKTDVEKVALEEIVREKLTSFFEKWTGYEMTDLHTEVLKQVEKPLIELCLKRTKGNQVRAAKILGINRNTLHKKMKELNIKVRS